MIHAMIALACLAALPIQQPAPTSAAPRAAAGSAIVTPVFAERSCRVTRPRNIARARMSAVDAQVSNVAFGTAFALEVDGRILLVTAAHVVALPERIESIAARDGTQYDTSDGETKIERGPSRVRVGGISARPTRMLVDEGLDVALLELEPADLQALGLEPLSSGSVARDAEVKLWGFPAVPRRAPDGKPMTPAPSASQTSQRTDVTDVRGSEVVCAPLNGVETRGGFSGGPVVTAGGTAAGMIMRSTTETTRCRAMPAIEELARSFDARAARTP